MFGDAWSFNYQRLLWRVHDPLYNDLGLNEMIFEEAFDRVDRYRRSYRTVGGQGNPVATKVWDGELDVLDKIVFDPTSQNPAAPRIWRTGGMEMVFSPFVQVTSQDGIMREVARLKILRSPNGNEINIFYDTTVTDPTNPLWHRIDYITDSYSDLDASQPLLRKIDFHYDDPTTTEEWLVDRITDFDGRELSYSYNHAASGEPSDLLRLVTAPESADFPDGRFTLYEYGHASDPLAADALKYNLTSVIFPNQAAPLTGGGDPNTSGAPALAWTYYDTQPFLGFVKTHTVGNEGVVASLTAGGTTTLDYKLINPSVPTDEAQRHTTWATRLRVKTPDLHVPAGSAFIGGGEVEYEYSFLGQMLREEILTDVRSGNTNVGSGNGITRSITIDERGKRISGDGAMGDQITAAYASDQRAELALPTAITRFPDSGRTDVINNDSDLQQPSQLGIEVVYEPVFNKPFKVTDAEGNTTTYFYDYMENLGASLGPLAVCLGYDDPAFGTFLADTVASRGIPTGGPFDYNEDLDDAQFCGNVIRIEYALATVSNLPPSNGSSSQEAVEMFRYNDHGLLAWHKDAEGNVHTRSYYPDSNPEGNAYPDAGDQIANEAGGGYLQSMTLDANDPDAGPIGDRNSGAGYDHIEAKTRFIYREGAGAQTVGAGDGQLSYTRPHPIATIDPRGVTNRLHINSHDEVTRISVAEAVASPSAPEFVALNYWRTMKYDANGNVIETVVQDDAHSPTVGTKTVLTYDILSQLRESVEAAGDLDLRTEFEYDKQLNLISRRQVASTPSSGADATVNWYFDERKIQYQVTRGLGSAGESTTTNQVDANGNLTLWTDAVSLDPLPHTVQVVTDGFDRVVKVVARDGTTTRMHRDDVGNVTQELVRGKVNVLNGVGIGAGTTPSSEIELASVEYEYDERYRLVRSKSSHSEHPGYEYVGAVPALDNGALSVARSISGAVVHEWSYDRLGRLKSDVDGDADVTTAAYDGLGRFRKVTDPVGNVTDNTFDASGNLTVVKESETWSLPGAFASEVFEYTAIYDALGRVRKVTEPNGQATAFEYDSRSNLINRKDQLGNELDYSYDRATRLTKSEQWLRSGGQNASQANHDPVDGVITIRQEWDSMSRLQKRFDSEGRPTIYEYDTLHRPKKIAYSDGTKDEFLFNADDELQIQLTQDFNLVRHFYDKAGRRVASRYTGLGGTMQSEVIGTSHQAWSYDGLGRMWSASDSNHVGVQDDVLTRFGYDTLGRNIWEEQVLGGQPALRSEHFYQGENRLVGQIYPATPGATTPTPRVVGRGYDGLDRLTTVTEGSVGVGAKRLAAKAYVGRGRLLLKAYYRVLGAGNPVIASLNKLNNAGTSTLAANGGSYDSNGRTIKHRWNGGPAGTPLITEYLSTYNGTNGVGTNRRTSEQRSHPGIADLDNYTFDSAYRMIGFDRMDGAALVSQSTRTLDGADKMTSFIDEGVNRMPAIDSAPNGLNQYLSIDGLPRTYDSNGGLQTGLKVSETDTATQTTVENDIELRFDVLKRAVMVRDDMGLDHVSYAYDALGRRVAKLDASVTPATVTTQFLYGGDWRVLEERDGLGNVMKQFVDGSGIDEHLQYRAFDTGGNESDYYYHCNEQGFVGALTDDTGTVKERYEYKWLGHALVLDVNGVALTDLGATVADESQLGLHGNPYTFQSRRLDPETGLNHFRHRLYDSLTGSFVSTDPSGLWQHRQGNGYSAFAGDPWTHSDPMGLSWWKRFKVLRTAAQRADRSYEIGRDIHRLKKGMRKFPKTLEKHEEKMRDYMDNPFRGKNDAVGHLGRQTSCELAGRVWTRRVEGLEETIWKSKLNYEKDAAKIKALEAELRELMDPHSWIKLGAVCVVPNLDEAFSKKQPPGFWETVGAGLHDAISFFDPGIEDLGSGLQEAFEVDEPTRAKMEQESLGYRERTQGGHVCFPAETLVATIRGMRPISQISPGDIVRTVDCEKLSPAIGRVCHVLRARYDGPLVTLEIGSEQIACTPEHPFLIVRKTADLNEVVHETAKRVWLPASSIRTGDEVLTKQGMVPVGRTGSRPHSGFVYCLRVPIFENFLVGQVGACVHNRKGARGGEEIVPICIYLHSCNPQRHGLELDQRSPALQGAHED